MAGEKEKKEIEVENIVASASIAKELKLDDVAKVLGIKYTPEQFPGLIYRLKEPRIGMLIFRSGKVNCTGAKNIEGIKEGIKTVTKLLKASGIPVSKDPKIEVQNIVAVHDLGAELNLNSIAMTLGLENIEYEPEQFPGLVYRVDEPKIAMLIFGSGKIVCTGAKNLKDIEIAVKKLVKELRTAELLR